MIAKEETGERDNTGLWETRQQQEEDTPAKETAEQAGVWVGEGWAGRLVRADRVGHVAEKGDEWRGDAWSVSGDL